MRSRPLGVEFTAAEAATVARFDAAPDAEESLRERVARAMFHVAASVSGCVDDEDDSDDFMDDYRSLADVAIAVMRGDDA